MNNYPRKSLITTFICFVLICFGSIACNTESNSEGSNDVDIKAVSAKGKVTYTTYCIACHGEEGKGMEQMNPPLIASKYVNGDEAAFAKILLQGSEGGPYPMDDGNEYINQMNSHSFLSDQQLAEVMTYVKNNFNNQGGGVTSELVAKARAEVQK